MDDIWRLRFRDYGVLDLAQWWARTATDTDAIAAEVLCEKLEAMGARRLQGRETRDTFVFSEALGASPSPDESPPSPQGQQR